MAKAKSQAEKKAGAAPRKPLDAFAHHQVRALEETGKAFAAWTSCAASQAQATTRRR